jgi:hypothetical protein
MKSELTKASNFVSRLLANPVLLDYTALQREEQILQFLMANAGQLEPTLSSPAFFPGKSWNIILSLLVQGLFETLNPEMKADIERIVDRDLS